MTVPRRRRRRHPALVGAAWFAGIAVALFLLALILGTSTP